MHNSGAFAPRERGLTCDRHPEKQNDPNPSFRGDAQHRARNPQPPTVVMDSGPAPKGASTMCNCTSGNHGCAYCPAVSTTVIASATKQSIFLADVPWIASLRSQ